MGWLSDDFVDAATISNIYERLDESDRRIRRIIEELNDLAVRMAEGMPVRYELPENGVDNICEPCLIAWPAAAEPEECLCVIEEEDLNREVK